MAMDAEPDRDDAPGDFEPGNVRGAGRWRVAALALMDVGRLTPAAATSISTSPAAGSGIGRLTGRNTSGAPGAVISIAVMVVGIALI